MATTTRRELLVRGGAGLAALGLGGGLLLGHDAFGAGEAVAAGSPIKVGFVHSLTGDLSITETSISDGAQLAVQQINAAGGINGRPIKPIIEDDASDFTIAVQKVTKLLQSDKVAIVIGGYTSASRVAMIPTFHKLHGLFFYGTYFEGLECDTSTYYSGGVPNQFLLDYVPWIMKNLGKKLYIAGSDYLYPRTVSAIVQKLAKASGGQILADRYFSLGTTDFGSTIADIASKKPDVVISNLVGDSTPAFYKQFASAGNTPDKLPIAATVTTEVEIKAMGPQYAEGHYMTSTYFESLDNPANVAYVKAYKRRYGKSQVTHMPQVGTYNAVQLFAVAAAKATDLSVPSLAKALVGATYQHSPEGQPITIAANHLCNHPSYVGRANKQGQYDIVATFKPRVADPFPAQIVPASKRPQCPTPLKA
jgi:urea transport system substrate-binding protein